MPYPVDPPKAKHDLLTPVLPLPSTSTSNDRSWMDGYGYKSTAALFAALDEPPVPNNLQPLTSVYSYGDSPPDKPLSRELIVIGFADSSLAWVRQLVQQTADSNDLLPAACWHRCTVAVKRADGEYGRRLPRSDLEKCHNFAQFLHRLKQQEAAAVLAQDKYHRFGLLVPSTDDRTARHFNDADADDSMEKYEAQDFCATCYVGRIDKVKAYLAQGAAPSSAAVGVLATNGVADNSNMDHGCWQPSATENTGKSATDTLLMDYDTNDDPWAAADPWNTNNEDGTATATTTAALDTSFHADAGAAAADRFYSGLTRTLATRADSRIYHMRAYNGWVKATQIAELDPRTNNTSNKRKKLGPPLRVLDLACGKGGDLGKWVLHPRGIQNYVGIDVARGSLVDAAKRVRSMRHKLKRCTFTCADLGADVPGRRKSSRHPHLQKLSTWSLQDEPEHVTGDPSFQMQRGGGVTLDDRFDVVSIQFAIHYMMQTRQRAQRFFQTVSELLEVGGNLICTTIDARVVIEHLMNLGLHFDGEDLGNKEDAVISVGNGACSLTFKADIVKKIFQPQPAKGTDSLDENLFGLEYTFNLVEGTDHASGVGDAVNLPEWLIPIPVLRALGEEAGLEIEYTQNFHEFYAQRKNESIYAAAHAALYNMKVLNRNGTISDDEYEISRLYCAIQFRKVRESRMKFEEDGEEVIEEEEEEDEQVDIDPAIKAKFLPMALLKAKKAAGADAWATFSSEEKNRLTEVELRKLASTANALPQQ